MGARKIKYGDKAMAVSVVMADIIEEIADLVSRIDTQASQNMPSTVQHQQQSIIERVQVRTDILNRLSQLLNS